MRYLSEKNLENAGNNGNLNFVVPKIYNLAWKWRFKPLSPWSIPEREIRDYYGEKITLYFKFISFYAANLMIIGKNRDFLKKFVGFTSISIFVSEFIFSE